MKIHDIEKVSNLSRDLKNRDHDITRIESYICSDKKIKSIGIRVLESTGETKHLDLHGDVLPALRFSLRNLKEHRQSILKKLIDLGVTP